MQVCTSLQTDNHASTPLLSFLQAGCPSCHPTNSVKALKAKALKAKALKANAFLNKALIKLQLFQKASDMKCMSIGLLLSFGYEIITHHADLNAAQLLENAVLQYVH